MSAFPVALMLATHCLIVPHKALDKGVLITNLTGCLSRAWCRLEIFACFLGSCQVFCHYAYGEDIDTFVELKHSAASKGPNKVKKEDDDELLGDEDQYLGFQLAGAHALPKDMPKVARLSLWWQTLRNWWWVDQPSTIADKSENEDHWGGADRLKPQRKKSEGGYSPQSFSPNELDPCSPVAENAAMLLVMAQKDRTTLGKIARMEVTRDEARKYCISISTKKMKLSALYDELGEISREDEKLQVLNMLLFLQCYFMGLLSQMEIKPEAVRHSKLVLRHVCTGGINSSISDHRSLTDIASSSNSQQSGEMSCGSLGLGSEERSHEFAKISEAGSVHRRGMSMIHSHKVGTEAVQPPEQIVISSYGLQRSQRKLTMRPQPKKGSTSPRSIAEDDP